MTSSSSTQATVLIRASGGRVTAARIRVLCCLLQHTGPRTHHEIENTLGADKPIDKVTLYRVLDWLVARNLAHKVSGDGDVWRFRSGDIHTSHQHAHFECTRCSLLTCLEDIDIPQNVLPPSGFRLQRSEFVLKGLCPACN